MKFKPGDKVILSKKCRTFNFYEGRDWLADGSPVDGACFLEDMQKFALNKRYLVIHALHYLEPYPCSYSVEGRPERFWEDWMLEPYNEKLYKDSSLQAECDNFDDILDELGYEAIKEASGLKHEGKQNVAVGPVFVDVKPGAVKADAGKALPGSNPKDKMGIKKVQLNLVPASSTIYQALAMTDGARKYGAFNWRGNEVLASIYIAAAMRHIEAWFDSGEEVAKDSKIPHLAHALACLGIIVDAKETGNLVDDRPPPGAASKLLEQWEKKE